MKKVLILALFFPLICFGAVDTKDGAAITTASNIDGFTSAIGKCGGQSISAGGSCSEQSIYISDEAQDTTSTTQYGNDIWGQSITVAANHTGYSVSYWNAEYNADTTIDVRVDDDDNPGTSPSYQYDDLISVTSTSGSNGDGTGWHEGVFPSESRPSLLSATGTYYFAFKNGSAAYEDRIKYNYDNNDGYAGGAMYTSNDGDWDDIDASVGNDLGFRWKKCDN